MNGSGQRMGREDARRGGRGVTASKADLHRGQPAEEPARQPRMVGENDRLNPEGHNRSI